MRFLLRVEAVNMAAFVSDTQDISTIRGGSLILLNWVEDLPAAHPELIKIFSGASSAVFEFDAESERSAEEVRKSLIIELADANSQGGKGNAQYATFQAAIAPLNNECDYPQASAEALTRIRVQQLQSPTVVLPEPSKEWAGICEVDDIRPAMKEIFRQGGAANETANAKMNVSLATFHRRPYGIEEKHSFFFKRKACGKEQDVVNDFNQLADYDKAGLLHRKLALIFLDGNNFGGFARNCQTPTEARNWASFVKHNQDAFLHHLFAADDPNEDMTPWRWSGSVITNRGNPISKKRLFRIEVLRWAGDDMLLVVPAWCGWWVLKEFYSVFGTLPWPAESNNTTGRKWSTHGNPEEVSHSGCMIFAHCNAPIHSLISLAEDLVVEVKNMGHGGDAFSYQILESFDHLGADHNQARLRGLPAILRDHPELLILNGENMQQAISSFREFSDRVPRKTVYEILKALRNSGSDETELMARTLSRYKSEPYFHGFKDALISQKVDDRKRDAAAWMHLSELWDYIKDPMDLTK